MSFDALLKKYFAFVLLALVAMVAYLQASGVMQLVGAALVSPPAASAFVARPAPPPPPMTQKSVEALLSRNPFDSITGALNKRPETESLEPQRLDLTDPQAVLGAPACDGIRAAIITQSDDPVWSVAALAGPGETSPKMRRVGDEVGGKQVAYIGFNPREGSPSVWMLAGGSLCQTMLFASQAAPVASVAAASSAAPVSTDGDSARKGPPKIAPDIAAKIQKISDTEYHVDRSALDKIMEDQAALMRAARIVPEQKDGQTVGLRLFGVRPDTLLGTIGIQNGDRLDTINGFNMASPEKALEAYARLRTAESLKVQINRRGQPVTIDLKFK